MQSTEEKKEIMSGIYIGDIVVSKSEIGTHICVDDIFEVLPQSSLNNLWYYGRKGPINASSSFNFRKATPEETNWYKSTYQQNSGIVLNIKNMPKETIINNYSIY